MTDEKPLYPRDLHPAELEPHYSCHVSAMTTEQLHHKADIAEQLAWRDQVIEELRARVGELEDKAAGYLHAFKDGCERSIEAVDALMARAESAEARVKELEESEAAHVRRMNEIIDKETKAIHKAWDEETDALESRITDLESQLTAARSNSAQLSEELRAVGDELAAVREEPGLEARVRDWLCHESITLTVAVRPADGRWVADLFDEDDPENFFASVEAETLPALLRAILEVEKGESR